MTVVLVASFGIWAGATLLLSRLPWFQRHRPLEDRLRPFVAGDESWAADVERWVHRH